MTLVVTHVLAPAPYGGLETVVEMLSRGQADAGSRVSVVGVFSKEPTQHPFWNSLSKAPVDAIPLVVGGRRYGAERSAIRRVLRERGTDILHTHGYRPDVLHAPVARQLGIRTVTTVHGFTGGSRRNRFYEWLQRRAFRRLDAVVAVSEKLRRDLVAGGLPGSRVHLIRNAWHPTSEPLPRSEARAHLGLPPEGKQIGWVGRLSPEKGPDVMLRAFARLGRPGTRLAFVGDGPMRRPLLALAEETGTASSVDWLGDLPGAARYLRAFDALAITSLTEGTPMVLFEAMAARIPIVTTSVGGIPDVVSDREALLAEVGDVEGIARALDRALVASPDVDARAGAAQARLQDEFRVGPWVERYHTVYRSVCR